MNYVFSRSHILPEILGHSYSPTSLTPLRASSTNWIHSCRLASLFLPELSQWSLQSSRCHRECRQKCLQDQHDNKRHNQCHITTIDGKVIGIRPKSQLIMCTHHIAGSRNNINTTQTKEINLTVTWPQLSTSTSLVTNHHRRQHYINDIVIRVELLLAPLSRFKSITSLPSTLTTSGVLVMTPCSLADNSQRFEGTCCFHSLNQSSMNWLSLWEVIR
jgi:hypothetical protein